MSAFHLLKSFDNLVLPPLFGWIPKVISNSHKIYMTVRVVLFLAAITAIICAKSIVGESLHYGSVVRIKAETASH